MAPDLAANALLPLLAYEVLQARGVGTVPALVLSGVFPAAVVIVRFARTKRVDGMGLAVLGVLALGAVASLISGSPGFVLAKESVLTAGLGLVLLSSLLARRPVMFVLGRKMMLAKDPARGARWDLWWDTSQTFRRFQRLGTAVWGVLFLGEAALRVALVFVLPAGVMLVVSQVLPLMMVGAVLPWFLGRFKQVWAQSEHDAEAATRDTSGPSTHPVHHKVSA
jgi:hypothetical protein